MVDTFASDKTATERSLDMNLAAMISIYALSTTHILLILIGNSIHLVNPDILK